MEVLGEVNVSIQYEQQPQQQLPLVIAEGNGPSLLDRNWLNGIKLNWSRIKAIRMPEHPVPTMLERFKDDMGWEQSSL